MKIKTKLFLLIIFCLGWLLSAQDVEVQLKLRYDSKIEYKREVYNRILQMIADNPSSDELDKLYFNLAELSTEVDRNNPRQTAVYYQQVLQYNRDFTYKDIVLYNIAYYSHKAVILQTGQRRQQFKDETISFPDSLIYSETLFAKPIRYYKRLLEEHPLSDYYPESCWRLGEIYLQIAEERNSKLAGLRAVDYYDLALNHPESPFYYQSLSGKAWAHFAMGEIDDALNLEYELLNKMDSIPQLENREILADEAVNNIAWAFCNAAGIEHENSNIFAAKIEIRLKKLHSENRRKQIMFALAQQFLDKNEPRFALDLYETIGELFPVAEDIPLISKAKIDVYTSYPDLAGSRQDAEAIVDDIIDDALRKYHPLSNWFSVNKNNNIQPAIAFLRELITDKEPVVYNDFLTQSTRNNYLRYRRLINDFAGYDSAGSTINSASILQDYRKNLVFMSQLLAQDTDTSDDYIYALRDLQEYNNSYPYHQDRVDFEKNIFFCYEKLYNFTQLDSTALVKTEFTGIDTLYITASQRYEEILRSDENWQYSQNELARVIFKRAEFLFQQENMDQAAEDFLAILDLSADDEITSDALRRLAEIAVMQNDLILAEDYLRQAMNHTEGYAQSDVYKSIVKVIEMNAEALLSQNKHNEAAAEFMRISMELEAVYPLKSIKFMTRAIDIYEVLGDDEKVNELLTQIAARQNRQNLISIYADTWQEADAIADYQRAIELRENFIAQYPGTNEAFRVKLQILDIYENKIADKQKAAEQYMMLYNEHADYDLGKEKPENIYLNSLRIYQDLDNEDKCRELTEKFINLYPDYSLIDLNLTYSDTDNLRTNIRKLKKIKDNINLLFQEEDYSALKGAIAEFRQIAAAVNVDSVQVDFSEDNLLWDKYLAYSDFHQQLKLQISNIENVFLLKKPQELLPVDASTRWQEDLTGGNDLIGKMLQLCNDYRQNILRLLQSGAEFQLQTPDYTHALWAIAAAYDHAYESVDQQIKNFVVKANQVNRPELQNNDFLQSELKRRIIAEGREYSFDFQIEAARLYQNLLYQFSDGKQYSDLWTRRSLTRLNEWGIRDADGAIVMLDEKMLIAEQSYANEEIEQEYNEIFALYQKRDYTAAQTRFINFTKTYSGHQLAYSALYYSGECYYNMGQLSRAMEIMIKVIDFERDKTPDALLRLGHCYNASGRKELAYQTWNRLLEEFPDHYLSDVIKLTFDKLKEQEEDKLASRITDKKKEKLTLKYRNYVQKYKQGDYKTAEKGFARLADKYPEHPLAYSSRFMQAEAAFMGQKYDSAEKIYSQLTAIDGNKKANSLYRLGQIAEKKGDIANKNQYWQQVLEDYPQHYLAAVISGEDIPLVTQQKSSTVTAKTAKPETRPVISDPAQILYKKALMSYRYNNFAQAIEQFQVFLADNANHRLAFQAEYLLADCYQKTGSYQQALAAFEKLLPNSGARRVETQLNIAHNHIRLQHFDKAKSILTEISVNHAGTFNAAQAHKLLKEIPGDN